MKYCCDGACSLVKNVLYLMNELYNQSLGKVKSVLDVWKIIEILTPTKNETLNRYFEYAQKHAADTKDFYKEINNKEALFLLQQAPFEQFDKNKLQEAFPEYEIRVHWHLYLGYLNWTEAEIAIEKKINELFAVKPKIFDNYKNRTNPVLTPIAALILNENMEMIDKSMVISTGAYAVGKIVREGFLENDFEDLINFEDNSQTLIVNLLKDSFDKVTQNNKFTLDRINYISNSLIKQLGIDKQYLISNPEICVRKITYRKIKKKEEVKQNQQTTQNNKHPKEHTPQDTEWAPPASSLEMFNSFFLKSIDLVRTNVNNFEKGSAIAKYLGMENKPDAKDILQDTQILQNLLRPRKMQSTRWPSSPKNSLALLQAGAINSILQDTENKEHLFAINGPPGTGKTTMLFDIIANIYVRRAINLAKFVTPSEGFEDKIYSFKSLGFEHKIKGVHPCIRNYDMVIGSSNNGAVENISEELSRYAKIDKIYHQELKFFDWLSNSTEGTGTCWGVFAAVLGNSTNRRNFMDKFWKQEFVKEKEEYKERTMFQYLNLLKGKKEAQNLKSVKPEYCTSKISTNNKWDKERQYFNELHKEILDIYHAIDSVIDLNKKKRNVRSEYNEGNVSSALEELTTYKENLESTLKYISSKVTEIEYEIMLLSLGLFKKIHAFFNTKKYRNFIQENLRLTRLKNEQLELTERTKVEISKVQNQIKKLQLTISQVKEIDQSLIQHTELLKSKNFDVKVFEEDCFWQIPHDNLHQATPYFNEEFEILRSKLFVQAVKLHEIFINANAEHFWSSLHLFSELMNGKLINIDYEIAQIAWKNFFIVIPIISTTFHSFDNMFKPFNHNDIAWLIIDEAGQAPPQYAAGAIYKSQNVIVVGDPMQTQPISILGQELINKLCQKLGVSYNDWSPSEVSVQHLADRNSLYQTKYGNITVGFPLLVHRRCQDPMFSICNNIAYNNKMIFAANNSKSNIRAILRNSRWINIEDNSPAKLKYESEAEFKELLNLIKKILGDKNAINLLPEIYIITMYKRFSHYIKRRLFQELSKLFQDRGSQQLITKISGFCKNNIGTIHVFQGKEADSVIMLLGAQHPEDYGARKIMTDKPNVLNVGISRAKNNLYIIGNKSIWLQHTHMNEIYDAILSTGEYD